MKYIGGVYISHTDESEDIFAKHCHKMILFLRNGYIEPQYISIDIISIISHQYNHAMRFNLNINRKSCNEKYEYIIFRMWRKPQLVITTWKLPSSKDYHSLNDALGIWVLPTQIVPISGLAHGLISPGFCLLKAYMRTLMPETGIACRDK